MQNDRDGIDLKGWLQKPPEYAGSDDPYEAFRIASFGPDKRDSDKPPYEIIRPYTPPSQVQREPEPAHVSETHAPLHETPRRFPLWLVSIGAAVTMIAASNPGVTSYAKNIF